MSYETLVHRMQVVVVSAFLIIGVSASLVEAQPAAAPPPDPGTWIGSAGGGIALTAGNSETLTFNAAFDATRDPKTRHVTRFSGLFLRGEQNDVVVANRLSLLFREQYALTSRSFVFGQGDYLRDTFKAIDYLVAATGGLGVKVVDAEATKFVVNGGLGSVWEKNEGLDRNTSVAITASEQFQHQISATSTFTHTATGLWKADDLADSLATISVGLGTKITEQLQLSIDLLDVFKNRPPTPDMRKHDLVLVTAVTAKF